MAQDVVLDLWLIRHAESLGNVDGTASDSPLTARGFEQADALRRALSGRAYDAVFVSPLIRARQTLDTSLGPLAPVVDARLAEFLPPPGARVLDTSRMSLDALLAFAAQKPSDPGESGLAFKARVAAWCDALPSSGRVIAVTHFGVVREVVARYVGFHGAPQAIAHTGIFRLAIHEGEVRVIAWNDTAHLLASAEPRGRDVDARRAPMRVRMPHGIELDHLVLRCAHLEASRAFYEAVGLVFVTERHGAGPEHFACTLGGAVLELYPASGRASASVLRLGLRVRDVHAVVERVREAGGHVVRADASAQTALVRDPDGNDIALSDTAPVVQSERPT